MVILDSLLIGGLRFVLDKVARAVDAEAQDASAPRERLLEAQMRLERGEITQQEFVEIERDVIAAIRDVRAARQSPVSTSGQDKISGVDIETYDSHV